MKLPTATGAKGVYTEAEDTYSVAFPRIGIKVTVEGRADGAVPRLQLPGRMQGGWER